MAEETPAITDSGANAGFFQGDGRGGLSEGSIRPAGIDPVQSAIRHSVRSIREHRPFART